jgi:hypothetical protein
MPFALTRIPTNYSYLVRVRGKDPRTGLPGEKWITVISDDEQTINQIKELAQEYMDEEPERYQLENITLTVTRALRRNPTL